jgi:hypothetical protein
MFGHKDIETTATVVAITDTSSRVEVNGKNRFEVVLDVAATDGPAFRTTTDHWFSMLFSPEPGDVLNVSYDPKSRKTKINTDGDPRYDIRAHEKKRHQEGDAAVEAAMAKPPGTATDPGNDPYFGAQYDPELAELVAEEQRVSAAAQAMPPSTPTPTPTPSPAVPPGESDRLDHLRMLRDSGQLTAEEFDTLTRQPPAGT